MAMDFAWENHSQPLVAVKGTVMNTSKWSETRVSSTGRGDQMQVNSSVTAKHEFWLQQADGKQIAIQLVNADFPLMQGQVLTMVNAPGGKTPNEPRWIYVVNHTADQTWFINAGLDQATASLLPRMRIWSMAVPVGLVVLSGAATIFPIAGAGYIGYRLFWRHREGKKIRAALINHLPAVVPK